MQNRVVCQTSQEPRPEKKVILRDMVVEQLRELINTEKLQQGQRLPPERALAARFAVSRHLVREALRVLEQQHIIVSRIGSGSYVENPDPEPGGVISEEILRQRSNLMEILEFRRTMEPRIAFLAASNTTKEAEKDLGAILADMRKSMDTRDLAAWHTADTAFHSYLAAMTGNFLYAKTIGLLHHGMVSFRATSDSMLDKQVRASFEAHGAIAAAVLAGDGEGAANAMEQHIITTVRTALATLPSKP